MIEIGEKNAVREKQRRSPSPPPHGPKFSQFHAVFRKMWQNHMLAPPGGSAPPSYGKSWIYP